MFEITNLKSAMSINRSRHLRDLCCAAQILLLLFALVRSTYSQCGHWDFLQSIQDRGNFADLSSVTNSQIGDLAYISGGANPGYYYYHYEYVSAGWLAGVKQWYQITGPEQVRVGQILFNQELGNIVPGATVVIGANSDPIVFQSTATEASITGTCYIVGSYFNTATGEFYPANAVELVRDLGYNKFDPAAPSAFKVLKLFNNRETGVKSVFRDPDDPNRGSSPWIPRRFDNCELILMYELDGWGWVSSYNLPLTPYTKDNFRFFSGSMDLNHIYMPEPTRAGEHTPPHAISCDGIHRFAVGEETPGVARVRVEDWVDGTYSDFDGFFIHNVTPYVRPSSVYSLWVEYPADAIVSVTPTGGEGRTYTEGTIVSLTVTSAPPGYVFDHWTGDPQIEGQTTLSAMITMNSDKSIKAVFRQVTYNLQLAYPTGAQIQLSPDPVGLGNAYLPGTEVTLTISAMPPGQYFSHWSGDPQIEGNTLQAVSITMNSDKTITANFVPTHTLQLSYPTGTEIQLSPSPVAPGNSYLAGTNVTVSITTMPDHQCFSYWSGDPQIEGSNQQSVTITMDSDKSITANFVATYTLQLVYPTGAQIDLSPGPICPGNSYEWNTQVTLTLSASPPGYSFSHWSGSPDVEGQTNTASTTTMNMDKQIVAHFFRLDFDYVPKIAVGDVLVDQSISFLPQFEGDVVKAQKWSFGDGTEESIARSPTHIFAVPGTHNVTLSVTTLDSRTFSTTKAITAQCGAPGNPNANMALIGTGLITKETIVDGIDTWVMTDQCPTIGSETVEIKDVSEPYSCGTEAEINQWEWVLDGVFKGTADYVSLSLSAAAPNIIELHVTDINGKTSSVKRKIMLEPCVPSIDRLNSEGIVVSRDGKDIDGGVVFNELDGIVDLVLDKDLIEKCPCNITSRSYTWDITCVNEKGIYQYPSVTQAEPYPFTTDRGFGNYKTKLTVVLNGDVDHAYTDEKVIMVKFPLPFVLCPPYGCRTPPILCNSLADRLVHTEIDKSQDFSTGLAVLSIPAAGTGFANVPGKDMDGNSKVYGFWDEGRFSSLRFSGDFVFQARIQNPGDLSAGMQAGIMARTSTFRFERMLLVGKADSKAFVLHRKKPREEAASCEYTEHTGDWFRIERTGDKLKTFVSATGSAWVQVTDYLGTSEIPGWGGTIEVGIAAAGDVSYPYQRVTFDNVKILAPGTQLLEPNTIINTVFADGNLISNWSFENEMHSFEKIGLQQLIFADRLEGSPGQTAFQGRHFCRISEKPSGATLATKRAIPSYLTKGGKEATHLALSFRVRVSVANTIAPAVAWVRADGTNSVIPLPGKCVSPNDGWCKYVAETPIQNATDFEGATLQLLSEDASCPGNVDFDNISLTPVFGAANNRPITTLTYADGNNQKFQTIQTVLNDDDPNNITRYDVVAALDLDDEGRLQRSYPLFTDWDQTDHSNVKKSVDDKAATYLRSPYSDYEYNDLQRNHGMISYETSPLNRPVMTYGRKAHSDVMNFYYNDDLENGTEPPHNTVSETWTGFDAYTDNYAMHRKFRNAHGFLVKTEETFASRSDMARKLVSTRDVDILDRVWQTVSPMGQNCEASNADCKDPTTFLYSTTGEVIGKSDPDAGQSESLYDRLGNLRLFRDGNKIAAKQFISFAYDAFGRPIKTHLVSDPAGSQWSTTNAENPSWPESVSDWKKWASLLVLNQYDEPPISPPPGVYVSDFTNVRGRLVAQHAYSSAGDVSLYFGYDERGREKLRAIKVLSQPVQRIHLRYNMAGQIISRKVEGKEPGTLQAFLKQEEYAYDHLNRLEKVLQVEADGSTRQMAFYEYMPDGKVRSRKTGIPGTSRSMSKYDYADRLNKQEYQILSGSTWQNAGIYEQKLAYNHRGNISNQLYYLRGATNPHRSINYEYDQFNRLLSADYGAGSAGFEGINYSSAEFDMAARYDDDGAITNLAQGSLTAYFQPEAESYRYYANSHRLNRVVEPIMDDGKDRSTTDTYEYDANGNMVLDKANRRKIDYDHRNLPIQITSYADDALTIVKRRTEYVYDAAGNRVVKRDLK